MNVIYSILYCVAWPFFSLAHFFRAEGIQNLPEEGGVLLCPNHRSLADPFYVAFTLGCRRPVRAMAKAELIRIPVLGFLLQKAGIFPVKRGTGDVAAIKQAIRYLRAGERLLLFPEGTRVREEADASAKHGAVMLALQTGVPILPIYIEERKSFFRPVRVIIGKPYRLQKPEGKANSDHYEAASRELLQRIYGLKERKEEPDCGKPFEKIVYK